VRAYDVADLIYHTGVKGEETDFNQLAELIQKTTTWDGAGGPGSIESLNMTGLKLLIISATHEIHQEIADLLAYVRTFQHKVEGKTPNSPPSAASLPASPPVQFIPKVSPFMAREEIILRALLQTIKLQFTETPLRKILDYIGEKIDIPVEVNDKDIEDLGINVDMPITVDFEAVSLRTVLDLMLREHNLYWTIYREKLLVASEDQIQRNTLEIRSCDVSDFPAFRDAQGNSVPDYDALIKIITNIVRPTTWNVNGGPGSVVPSESPGVQALAIKNSWAIQDEIDRMFAALRALRKSPITEEDIEHLPPLPAPTQPKPTPKWREKSLGMPSGMF
jgi:hypothetical protein